MIVGRVALSLAGVCAIAAVTVIGSAPAGATRHRPALPPPPGSAVPVRVPIAEQHAVHVATRHDMTAGIAVLDTHTGAIYAAGDARRDYASASVAKTLIATKVLLDGLMYGENARLAHRMITQSDNEAAYALYEQIGEDALLPDLEQHYGIEIGDPPTEPGSWGTTQITARGMVRFYAAIRRDHTVWPWLSRAMHHYESTSSAGEPNSFGIAAAAPESAVKNGWLLLDGDPDETLIHTTGYVDDDRYAVAILDEGPADLYYAPGERIVTREAKLVMPNAQITPMPRPQVATLSRLQSLRHGGFRLTITGSNLRTVRKVDFGRRRGQSLHVFGSRRLAVTVPRHRAGAVHVRVRSKYGWSARHLADVFTFRIPRGAG